MKRNEIIRFLILRSIGNFLLLFALFGVVATFGPAVAAEVKYRVDEVRGVHYVVGDPTTATFPNFNQQSSLFVNNGDQTVMVPGNTSFWILIPKIGASAQIIPNVDPGNEKEYLAALSKGVAHARGTVFPGIVGTTYLFAHSTDSFWDVGRYNAIFYLLKNMAPNDAVTVFFNNKRYNYNVTSVQIVNPDEVNYLINAQKTEEQLVLQTCWPPGTTLKRLLVVAKPTN